MSNELHVHINMSFQNKLETGLSRSLIFDGNGQRNDIILDILELTPAGNQTVLCKKIKYQLF